jgi:hypothetical protein
MQEELSVKLRIEKQVSLRCPYNGGGMGEPADIESDLQPLEERFG